jgi:hypothetical protein
MGRKVTGLALILLKIVEEFEFMPMTGAPAEFEPAHTAPESIARARP